MRANVLLAVKADLLEWQKAEKGKTSGRCLEAVRWALKRHDILLPAPMARPRNTAFCNYEELAKDPGRWGWRRWSHKDFPGMPMPPALVYFKGCGKLADGRIAGHIAIWDPADGTHTANARYKMSSYWVQRLVGAFVLDD